MRSLLLIHASILISFPIYVLVVWLAERGAALEPMPEELYGQVLPAGIAVAVLCFIASFLLPDFIIKRFFSRKHFEEATGRPGLYSSFFLRTLATDVLIETGVIVALILGLLGGGLAIVAPFAAVAVALMLYHWPGRREMENMGD